MPDVHKRREKKSKHSNSEQTIDRTAPSSQLPSSHRQAQCDEQHSQQVNVSFGSQSTL